MRDECTPSNSDLQVNHGSGHCRGEGFIHLFDAGVYQSLWPKGPLDRSEEIARHAGGLVGQHLRAWIEYRKGND